MMHPMPADAGSGTASIPGSADPLAEPGHFFRSLLNVLIPVYSLGCSVGALTVRSCV
jgi:hypothetical protein